MAFVDYLEGSEFKKALLTMVPDLPPDRTTISTYEEACTNTTKVMVMWQSNDGDVHNHHLGHVPRWINPRVARIDEESLTVLKVRAKMTSCL